MTGLPTPRLVDLDDPLSPRAPAAPAPPPAAAPAPAPPARAAAAAQPRQRVSPKRKPVAKPPAAQPSTAGSLADEQVVGVFARMPESLSDRLADTVRALNADRPRHSRVTQQDVLGALVDVYLSPEDTAALGEHVDAYRRRARR